MPVSGSSFTIEHPQADGSRWCTETHVYNGRALIFYYLSPEGFDHQAKMEGRIALANAQLADDEADANFERDGPLTVKEMTVAQMAARLRERYLNASREDSCRLCYWLIRRIVAGHITDAQVRNAFGLTAGQWTTFKTNNVQPRHDAWATVLAATGG